MAEQSSHHVIYVPGLGDGRTYGQDGAVRGWQKFGIDTEYMALGWADKQAFEPKLERLLNRVNQKLAQGKKVSLVGVSAGASAVLNAYAKQPNLHSLVLICGKVNNPESIGGSVYKINPAFKESVFKVKDSLASLNKAQRSRIMSIHPLYDGSVPVADTLIDGAKEASVPVIGHRLGVFFTIAFRGQLIANFIKSHPSR